MTRPSPTQQQDEVVQGPALIRDHHKQDREISPVAGSPKAWRSASTLEAAYDTGKLQGGNSKYSPEARYEAGLYYQRVFLESEGSSGTDSTQALNISRSSRMGSGNDVKARAWDKRLCIESHLGQRDRIIIRMVCGENHFPSQAIRMVCNDYKDTISARFREALDSLIEAEEAARRHHRKFNMEVKA